LGILQHTVKPPIKFVPSSVVLIENLADVKLSNLKTQDEHVLTQFCFS